MEGYEKKRLIGKVMQGVGIALGVIGLVLMIKWHPALVSIVAGGAASYFIGAYLRKV